jgi:hypothetical protein
MTIAEGTPHDGLRVGADTRRRAAASGRPVSYQVLVELGWFWAAASGQTPHLVPPYGDAAHCGRPLSRADRHPVTQGIAEHACAVCWKRALGNTPRRSR